MINRRIDLVFDPPPLLQDDDPWNTIIKLKLGQISTWRWNPENPTNNRLLAWWRRLQAEAYDAELMEARPV